MQSKAQSNTEVKRESNKPGAAVFECRLRWRHQGSGRGIDACMNSLVYQAGIAMPRWAFIQTYLDQGISFELIERIVMARPTLTAKQAAKYVSFESACARGWFDLPEWMKVRRPAVVA